MSQMLYKRKAVHIGSTKLIFISAQLITYVINKKQKAKTKPRFFRESISVTKEF